MPRVATRYQTQRRLALAKDRVQCQWPKSTSSKGKSLDDQLQLLLTEFRAFRDTEWREFRESVSAWQQGTGERVATLETLVKDVVGNGQPGRLTNVESAVSGLQRWRYWLTGIAATTTAASSFILHYIWPFTRHQ